MGFAAALGVADLRRGEGERGDGVGDPIRQGVLQEPVAEGRVVSGGPAQRAHDVAADLGGAGHAASPASTRRTFLMRVDMRWREASASRTASSQQ